MSSKIGIIVAMILFWIWGATCALLIKSYHESKPLGLQTIFGRVICILMSTLLCVSTYHGLVYIPCCVVQFIDIDENILKVLAALSCITIQAVHSALFLALITKYLSIYHSCYIYSLDEEQTIATLKWFMVLVPVVSTTIEYTQFTDINDTISYLPLVIDSWSDNGNTNSPKTEIIKTFGFAVLFALTCILYGRLEFDENHFSQLKSWIMKLRMSPQTGIIAAHNGAKEENAEVEYKISVLRIAFAMLLMFGIVAFARTGNVLAIVIGAYIIANVILPSIFIVNHSSLRQHFTSKVVSLKQNVIAHIKMF